MDASSIVATPLTYELKLREPDDYTIEADYGETDSFKFDADNLKLYISPDNVLYDGSDIWNGDVIFELCADNTCLDVITIDYKVSYQRTT